MFKEFMVWSKEGVAKRKRKNKAPGQAALGPEGEKSLWRGPASLGCCALRINSTTNLGRQKSILALPSQASLNS